MPEETGNGSDIVKALVRGAVFVNQSLAMLEGHDAGNGGSVVEGQPNAQGLSQAVRQILKPSNWLRWETVSTASSQKKLVKLPHLVRVPSFFHAQILPFSPPDLPLDTVWMKSSKHRIRARTQIQKMLVEGPQLGNATVLKIL